MIEFVINAKQLRKALKDIKQAENNGFMYCEAVYKLVSAGKSISENIAEYSDLIEKAHPTDGNFNWGRLQGVTRTCKFVRGKLIPKGKEGEE